MSNREINKLYNQIGAGYNQTRCADPYITSRLFSLLSAEAGKAYIDVGCGTGNYTTALAAKGLNWCGVDPSETMLATAKQGAAPINWVVGSADLLPAPDSAFDGGIANLTIHHWADLGEAFQEIHRVMKPGARFVIFTATPEQTSGYWLNHYFPKMMADSTRTLPSVNSIELAATKAGLVIDAMEEYAIQPGLQDHFLYVGKDNPAIYFDETIRKGISSFAALANQAEVTSGLKRLREDMDSHRFDNLRKKYANSSGDYLFICLRANTHLFK
jgi:ubiquinone/menaquinone biosynthesis C-methylase UbiE